MKTLTLILTCMLIIGAPVAAQDVTIDVVEYAVEPECSGQFVTHTLDHIVTVPGGDDVRMFEANGSGVGINDLDNDGDLDIVLGNHAGMNSILWNEGNLQFRTEQLDHGDSRAVNIVDIDADGWLDIMFTRTKTAPTYWHNMGNGNFEQARFPYVAQPIYSLGWADLDGDIDLDLVGATYDAGLLSDLGQDFLASNVAGVYFYENRGDGFGIKRISNQAQALAILLVDLNDDQRLDIVIGNDFGVPDYFWYQTDDGWQAADAFPTFTHSTMSYDAADIDNDGTVEIFSTDMKPYSDDEATMDAWHPLMEAMMNEPHNEDDPQVMENVLQVFTSSGGFENDAVDRGVDASGWSWSGKFGDLDQDGYLDLYIVNGMMEVTTFAHLPQHELVEENQAYRNDRMGNFVTMPEWGLASKESGRGMSMADLDGDGDLDIVVNNVRTPAQLFENQICDGSSLQIDLEWSESLNTHAIGAEVTLFASSGKYTREIRTSSGYLSSDATRLHFGYPSDATLKAIEVIWPDGEITLIESGFSGESVISVRR